MASYWRHSPWRGAQPRGSSERVYLPSIGLALFAGILLAEHLATKYRAKRDPEFAQRFEHIQQEAVPRIRQQAWRRGIAKILGGLVTLALALLYAATKRKSGVP